MKEIINKLQSLGRLERMDIKEAVEELARIGENCNGENDIELLHDLLDGESSYFMENNYPHIYNALNQLRYQENLFFIDSNMTSHIGDLNVGRYWKILNNTQRSI